MAAAAHDSVCRPEIEIRLSPAKTYPPLLFVMLFQKMMFCFVQPVPSQWAHGTHGRHGIWFSVCSVFSVGSPAWALGCGCAALSSLYSEVNTELRNFV